MCFVWIWEQTAIISLYSINWLVCIIKTESVYCAVRTGYIYIYIFEVYFCFWRFDFRAAAAAAAAHRSYFSPLLERLLFSKYVTPQKPILSLHLVYRMAGWLPPAWKMYIFCSHDFKILTFRLLVKSVRIAQSCGGLLFQKIKCPQTVNEFQHNTKPESSLVSVMQRIHQVRNFPRYLFNLFFNIFILSVRRNSKVRPPELHKHCPSPLCGPPASRILLSLIFSSRWYSDSSKKPRDFPEASAGYESCIRLWPHLQIFWSVVTKTERLVLFCLTTYFDRLQSSSRRQTKQQKSQQPFELRKRCVGVKRLYFGATSRTFIADGRGMWHERGTRNAYRVSVAKSERKRPLGRPWCKYKHPILGNP